MKVSWLYRKRRHGGSLLGTVGLKALSFRPRNPGGADLGNGAVIILAYVFAPYIYLILLGTHSRVRLLGY